MTKREYYNIIIENMQDFPEVVEFAKREIELLNIRNAKSRAKSDAVADAIKNLLTIEPKTIAEIVKELNDESVTSAKAAYRLSKLAADGYAVRTEVKVDKRKLAAYSKAEV